MHLITVQPIHDELRQQRPSRLFVDTREAKCVVDRQVGLPIAGDTAGLGAVLDLARMSQPATPDMLYESTINLFRRTTALTPIQHELCPNTVCKSRVDTRLCQNL